MIERNSTDPKAESRTRPLCRSYLLAIHGRLAVEVRNGGNVRSEPVRWALGVLADGSCEVLGAWSTHGSLSWSWQDAVEGLRVRGVEKIGFVFELGCEPLHTMHGRRVRTLHRSEEVVRQLQRQACRAIKRHEPCSDVAEAAGLVEDILSRAELGMGSGDGSLVTTFKRWVGTEPTSDRTGGVRSAAFGA